MADSTTNAQYVAPYIATKKIIYIRGLLAYKGVVQQQTTTLYMDNAAAEHLVRHLVHHQRTKHIEPNSTIHVTSINGRD